MSKKNTQKAIKKISDKLDKSEIDSSEMELDNDTQEYRNAIREWAKEHEEKTGEKYTIKF